MDIIDILGQHFVHEQRIVISTSGMSPSSILQIITYILGIGIFQTRNAKCMLIDTTQSGCGDRNVVYTIRKIEHAAARREANAVLHEFFEDSEGLPYEL